MKSKFEPSDENGGVAPIESGDRYDPEASEVVEVDDNGPGVATSKGSKLIVLVASAILITVVLYFFFFTGSKNNNTKKLQEVPVVAATAGPIAKAENIDDFPAEDYILEKPKEPELPKLPELPKDVSNEGGAGFLPSFIEIPKSIEPVMTPQATAAITAAVPNSLAPNNNINPASAPTPVPPPDPRKSPMIVVGGAGGSGGSGGAGGKGGSGGGASSVPIGVGYENNIVQLKRNTVDDLQKTQSSVIPTVVANMPNTIIQGKILTAVLETAISTELPGFVRAIVSRDVYAESGNNILIPKGSRLYGSYSSEIIRGQGRVQIGWTRLIRPDGVDMNITFGASDQFGRAGIAGDVDNKYGSIIGNTILTSVLAVGGAIIAEKLAGGSKSSTTTTDALGNVTSTGQASNKLIYDASKALIDTAGQVVGNAVDLRPIIRIPQGTRITILANADITLPTMKIKNRKGENE